MHGGGVRPDSGTRVVAVLPFDNLGDSADAYFADGVADEIRTKLAQVAGLEVIARGSSVEYQHTTRRPAAIARELGADYLLTGTVRWEKVAGAIGFGSPPSWWTRARAGGAHPLGAAVRRLAHRRLSGAGRHRHQRGRGAGRRPRRQRAARVVGPAHREPRRLRGIPERRGRLAAMKSDQAGLRRAIGFYERAVALDSTFVQAWSQLSRARTSLYSNGVPDPALGEQARWRWSTPAGSR